VEKKRDKQMREDFKKGTEEKKFRSKASDKEFRLRKRKEGSGGGGNLPKGERFEGKKERR